ncbi:MAG TPA: type II CRISPR RNA-guided endonuclease Cas9 [Beijerinckiaceae bacterium]|nr:type II CRISPR RNA-guided endonuclease Cas9 [Beijerinckiaceae bacterium]
MERIFGFDIGTTSIGFAAIDHDPERRTGAILRLGVRIFPEARDRDGAPLNQIRRQKRMMRRQLRRRRARRRALNEALTEHGLLPPFGSEGWREVMKMEPFALRARGLAEPLEAYEVGRALYHLAQRRHFKGRDLDEQEDERSPDAKDGADADEKKATADRQSMLQALRASNQTLGQFLAAKGPPERRRGVHALRSTVLDEFDRLWGAQSRRHAILADPDFRARVSDVIFAQRPVFWRKNTLGQCRFMPDEPLCPKGSWLSSQRRMLEKLNNLAIEGGNARPLDAEERAAILEKLQIQASMSWSAVRTALKPIYKSRGEPGLEKRLRFNLEVGGESKLLGNALEAKLAAIFGEPWERHPQQQAIRDCVDQRLRAADYAEIGPRVVIMPEQARTAGRTAAAESFIRDFGVTPEQAAALRELRLPTGWEPYSTAAIRRFLPNLENGVRFGALVNGPDWQEWRDLNFPGQDRPTGEILDRLPSPASRDEQKRIAAVRNPTVVRIQNELRKVVNNLIGLYGKPDRIRIELAREVGKSKREREEMQIGLRRQEKRRRDAAADLQENGIEPSRKDIEKWMLWKESKERCPYTGDQISFDALFHNGEYDVEHIFPRSRSLDDSFANKTLCRRDVNIAKGNRTPFEHFEHRPDEWEPIADRVQGMVAPKGGPGMSPGKARRFVAKAIPEGFAARQLNDTGFAARQAVSFLKRLWPDVGLEAPGSVQPVTGRVTAQLRRLWGLNNILSDDGEKTRGDHRHHAVDALVVACAHPGMTQRLSSYWQAKDLQRAGEADALRLPPPWDDIRNDAASSVDKIIVSHRVRKKVSGPLHKETTYGDTKHDVRSGKIDYREFVTRKKVEVLTKGELEDIRDPFVRKTVNDWVDAHGGNPKKAFAAFPRVSEGGSEIRKVRLISKQQLSLMTKVSTGYADLGSNHHIAIYRLANGKADFEVVSLFEASRRLAKREPLVRRKRDDGAIFVMSLSAGEALEFRSGPKKGIWIVSGAWANGQVVLEQAMDAGHSTTTRPAPGAILSEGAQKVCIDPIGRVRPAHD